MISRYRNTNRIFAIFYREMKQALFYGEFIKKLYDGLRIDEGLMSFVVNASYQPSCQ